MSNEINKPVLLSCNSMFGNILKNHRDETVYMIWGNKNIPYVIYVNYIKKKLTIYKRSYDHKYKMKNEPYGGYQNVWAYVIKICECHYKHIIFGKTIYKNNMCKTSNSKQIVNFLVELHTKNNVNNEKMYMHIGSVINIFTTSNTIIRYRCDIDINGKPNITMYDDMYIYYLNDFYYVREKTILCNSENKMNIPKINKKYLKIYNNTDKYDGTKIYLKPVKNKLMDIFETTIIDCEPVNKELFKFD